MAKTTTQKLPMEKHEIEKMTRMAIRGLMVNLMRNSFTIETDGDTVMVETTDIKAFISRRQIIILFSFIDIQHNDEKSVVKIYDYEKDDYTYINMDNLRHELEALLELAKQKVKEKLYKVLSEI
jgi:hypothetical protein